LTLGEFGVWEESTRNDAFVAEWHGRRWVCPRYPRLRMLEGLVAFSHSYPGPTSRLLVPERAVRRATAELEALYRRDPAARSHILTSGWHVPLRWFAAFVPAEREVVDLRDGTRTIRYRTAMAGARARVAEAIEVLDDAGFEDPVVSQVRDFIEWLEGFDDEAMVELDYGSVAGLFGDADLVMDDTVSDVHASLEALRREDYEEAGRHYGRAAGRWARAQALTYSN
jgi:hypothetical protein